MSWLQGALAPVLICEAAQGCRLSLPSRRISVQRFDTLLSGSARLSLSVKSPGFG